MSTEDKKTLTPQILALYLGCEVQWGAERSKSEARIWGEYSSQPLQAKLHAIDLDGFVSLKFGGSSIGKLISEIQPILRPLSSITETDASECWILRKFNSRDSAVTNPSCAITDHTFHANLPLEGWVPMINFLRSKGYDCDGLIDSGIAITQPK